MEVVFQAEGTASAKRVLRGSKEACRNCGARGWITQVWEEGVVAGSHWACSPQLDLRGISDVRQDPRLGAQEKGA